MEDDLEEYELPALTPLDRTLRKRRGTPEDDLHRMVWKALRQLLHPAVVAWSTENRDLGVREGLRRKQRGVIAGAPDMVFHWPHGQVAYIELKAKGNAPSAPQRALHRRLDEAGVPVGVCRSLDEVLRYLFERGVPMRGRLR